MPKKSRKNVGLIGLGIIGSRVANALRLAGYHVYVWNRTPRAAPNFLASPRQVAELCDIIQIFVSDAQALFDVLDTMGDALTGSHIILCNATVGPEATLDAARLVRERGAQFLDAPFTGSRAAAESRELVYYIGGDDKTYQAVEPVLKASSKAIVKIGKIGDAATVKVATNMMSAVAVQTLAEAYAIVKASGIDPLALVEALKHHGVRSGVVDAKLTKILARDYEPHFSLKHMFKDVQLGIHIANSLDIDLPATTSTAGVMYGGLTRGWADEDFSVLARSYQTENNAPPLYAPELPPAPAAKPAERAKAAEIAKPMEGEKPAEVAKAAEGAKAVPKHEPARELTPDDLRNIGIKVPDAPAPEVDEKGAPPAMGDGMKAEARLMEEGKPGAEVKLIEEAKPIDEGKPQQIARDDAKKDAAESAAIAPEAQDRANGEPAEPARPHTPFVRIRRWFGTGSPN